MGALERVQNQINIVDPSGKLPSCKIRIIEIGPSALEKISILTQDLVPRGSSIGLIVDKTKISKNLLDVKQYVLAQLSENFSVRVVELDDGHPELHASEEVIAQSIKFSQGLDAIVSVGGGTITDIGKMTTIGIEGVAHIVIQTAASVDGYTDDVSVILKNGVKRTVASRWPDAVIADTILISQAPKLMNIAGFGEIYSMFTAPADWRIAALLGFERKFNWAPIYLLQGVGEGIEDWSIGLKDARVESIDRLVEALAVRGITTGVAGTTACLSGIEHLISHMLDMNQGAHGKPIGQHGSQVGVGSLVAAVIWEFIFETFDKTDFELPDLASDAIYREKVLKQFKPLDASGALGEECWKDYSRKVLYWRENLPQIRSVLRNWDVHTDELKKLIKSSEQIAMSLVAAGSPIEFDALEPAIDEELSRWAISGCHLMRDRFVGIDLLEFSGKWNQSQVDLIMFRVKETITRAKEFQMNGGKL